LAVSQIYEFKDASFNSYGRLRYFWKIFYINKYEPSIEERDAHAIFFRHAIGHVFSEKVETIIMDEPTTHLDEVRGRQLVNVLNSFFMKNGGTILQTIMTTHNHEIEDPANVLHTISKRDSSK